MNNENRLTECSIGKMNTYRCLLSVCNMQLSNTLLKEFQFNGLFNALSNMTLDDNGFNENSKTVRKWTKKYIVKASLI